MKFESFLGLRSGFCVNFLLGNIFLFYWTLDLAFNLDSEMDNLKTNADLYRVLRNSQSGLATYDVLRDEILQFVNKKLSKEELQDLNSRLQKFCCKLTKKWEDSSRNAANFLRKNQSWLQQNFCFPQNLFDDGGYNEEIDTLKPFALCSDKQKARRTACLRSQYSGEELLYCAKLKLREEGHTKMSKLLDFLVKNPEKVEKLLHACENELTKLETYTPDKALSIMTSLDLSKRQYQLLRNITKAETFLFPSYYRIQLAKSDCYPDKESIIITEKEAQINLQNLLDHTIIRIFKSLNLNEENERNLTLFSKWGCDGASGQSLYKQGMEQETDLGDWDDSSIFVTSFVPIKLIDSLGESSVVWENKKTSSSSFCRPIRFCFCKETPEVIIEEVNRIRAQISSLLPTTIGPVKVKHELIMTMVDGKICNAITQTSSAMRCYICSAGPKDMNNLLNLKIKKPNEEFYNFGLSPLHAKIRFFECLLHISYNLGFKKWTTRSPEQKALQSASKLSIQNKFRMQLGLIVDQVRQGKGTTNDGNTARKFFQNPKISSEITGIDERLVYRFAVILQAISSGMEIHAEKFGSFARETAHLFVSLYPWYYMPATVHKVLIHGEEIIKKVLVPIGQLSEEAQEARNKDFRKFRQYKSRKLSRQATNADILHALLITSDPYISNMKPKWSIDSGNKLFPEALDLSKIEDHRQSETSDTEMEWEETEPSTLI